MGEKGTSDYLKRYIAKHEGFEPDITDPNRAFNPDTGQNAHWDESTQQWKDSKTGKPMDFPATPGARSGD